MTRWGKRAVQTVNKLWNEIPDKHWEPPDYRTIPPVSPVHLLMGRKSHNKLPTTHELLVPTAYDPLKVEQLLDKTKDMQRFFHMTKRGQATVTKH